VDNKTSEVIKLLQHTITQLQEIDEEPTDNKGKFDIETKLDVLVMIAGDAANYSANNGYYSEYACGLREEFAFIQNEILEYVRWLESQVKHTKKDWRIGCISGIYTDYNPTHWMSKRVSKISYIEKDWLDVPFFSYGILELTWRDVLNEMPDARFAVGEYDGKFYAFSGDEPVSSMYNRWTLDNKDAVLVMNFQTTFSNWRGLLFAISDYEPTAK